MDVRPRAPKRPRSNGPAVMCGICGIVRADPHQPVDEADLAAMTWSLSHRGPDDQGFYLQGPVGLGHRRLAIIDLATGRQPLSNEDGSIWVVGNGEIYNFPELRPRLEQQGHVFRTRSDTEVILHAYETYGDRCVEHLNGMFAFALWDQGRRRLLLARDRVGIKPLYYTLQRQGLWFASELKALLTQAAVPRELDRRSLCYYLTYEYVPSPWSIFQGIYKLPPGHLLTYGNGRLQVERYWDFAVEQSEAEPRQTAATRLPELRRALQEAVRLELLADVPVGVLLSGGLDSSTIAALAAKEQGAELQTFAVGFADPSFDESQPARQVARWLGSRHHEITLTPAAMLALVPRLGELLDEPLGDSSFIPTFLLSRYVREHVKVALGGDGGDELLGGYPTLTAHLWMERYQRGLPRRLRRQLAAGLEAALPVSFDNISFDFKVRRFLAGQDLPPWQRQQLWLGSFTPAQQLELWAEPPPLREAAAQEPARLHWEACRAADLINRVFYSDLKLYLEGDILVKVDRASMANSLEVRVPLLNLHLLEFSARLARELKINGLTTKVLLRRAVQDLLPEAIIRRPKKGFNMPVARWLTGPLKPLAADLLAPDRLKRGGLFRPEYVQRLWQEHQSRRRDHRKLLWTLLAFELWREAWLR